MPLATAAQEVDPLFFSPSESEIAFGQMYRLQLCRRNNLVLQAPLVSVFSRYSELTPETLGEPNAVRDLVLVVFHDGGNMRRGCICAVSRRLNRDMLRLECRQGEQDFA